MTKVAPVQGLAQLDRVLSALPKNLQKNAYRAGLTAAAAVIRDEARVRAPKRTGQLAKSIKSGSARQNQDGTFSITIGPRGKHGYLGLFHEYGTRAHFIARTDKGVGRVGLRNAVLRGDNSAIIGPMKIGDDFVSGVISHPGHAAHPFMRPALDAKWQEAVEAFRLRIVGYIEGKTGFDASALPEAA